MVYDNFDLIKNCFLHWKNLLENLNSEQFEECQIRDSFLSKPGGEEKCWLVWLTFFTFATHKKWNLEMQIKIKYVWLRHRYLSSSKKCMSQCRLTGTIINSQMWTDWKRQLSLYNGSIRCRWSSLVVNAKKVSFIFALSLIFTSNASVSARNVSRCIYLSLISVFHPTKSYWSMMNMLLSLCMLLVVMLALLLKTRLSVSTIGYNGNKLSQL